MKPIFHFAANGAAAAKAERGKQCDKVKGAFHGSPRVAGAAAMLLICRPL